MWIQTLHHHPDRYQWVINCRQTHYDKTVDSKVKDVGTITESHWPWKKSMPAKSVSANTMQLSSAVLGWPGDGHCCLMYYVEWYVFKKFECLSYLLLIRTFSESMISFFSVGSSQLASSFLPSAIRTATVLEIFLAREPENVYCCTQFSCSHVLT